MRLGAGRAGQGGGPVSGGAGALGVSSTVAPSHSCMIIVTPSQQRDVRLRTGPVAGSLSEAGSVIHSFTDSQFIY